MDSDTLPVGGSEFNTPKKPLVTIGIPAYNSARFVRQAVESALGQTYPEIEVLVVDDASEDGTLDALEGIDDPRLRVLANPRNLGFADNHNRVLREARGEYVKLLHCDDLIVTSAIETQVAAILANPGVVLVTSSRAIIDDEGVPVMRRGPSWPEGVVAGAEALRRIVREGANVVGEPSAGLFRTRDGLEAGGYSAEFRYAVDLEFWTRLLARGDLYYIPRSLAAYRLRAGQVSGEFASAEVAEMSALAGRLRHAPGLGITDADVARGVGAVSRRAPLRRAVLRYFGMPRAQRRQRLVLGAAGLGTVLILLTLVLLNR